MFDRFTDTFKSSLSSVTRTLFRRKMPTEVDPVLPTESQPVSVYVLHLETIHRVIGTKRLRMWKVTKLERLKSDRPSRHESTRAWVCGPEGVMSFVIFEKAGGETMKAASLPDLLRMLSHNASKSSSSSGSSLCSPDAMAIGLGLYSSFSRRSSHSNMRSSSIGRTLEHVGNSSFESSL